MDTQPVFTVNNIKKMSDDTKKKWISYFEKRIEEIDKIFNEKRNEISSEFVYIESELNTKQKIVDDHVSLDISDDKLKSINERITAIVDRLNFLRNSDSMLTKRTDAMISYLVSQLDLLNKGSGENTDAEV